MLRQILSQTANQTNTGQPKLLMDNWNCSKLY